MFPYRCLSTGCLGLLLFVSPSTSNAQTTAVGATIGTIVKSAISTAVPALGTVLNLIWGHLQDSTATKASKANLQTAAQTQSAQDQLKQKIVASAQQAIQPVSQVAGELTVITKFLGPSVTASQYIAVARALTYQTPTPWTEINNAWQSAKAQLGPLQSVPDSQTNKVRDLYLRDKLTRIRSVNQNAALSIDQHLTDKNLSQLKDDLGTLSNTVSDMAAVAGYELADLQADVTDLATWAKAPAAVVPATVPPIGPYKAVLDKDKSLQ